MRARDMFEELTRAARGIREGNAWHRAFGPTATTQGDLAPDFELCDVKGENPIRLSQFRSTRPVALVFGSFT